jgi:hypothetical protein
MNKHEMLQKEKLEMIYEYAKKPRISQKLALELCAHPYRGCDDTIQEIRSAIKKFIKEARSRRVRIKFRIVIIDDESGDFDIELCCPELFAWYGGRHVV